MHLRLLGIVPLSSNLGLFRAPCWYGTRREAFCVIMQTFPQFFFSSVLSRPNNFSKESPENNRNRKISTLMIFCIFTSTSGGPYGRCLSISLEYVYSHFFYSWHKCKNYRYEIVCLVIHQMVTKAFVVLLVWLSYLMVMVLGNCGTLNLIY